jgi:hypothetical protein
VSPNCPRVPRLRDWEPAGSRSSDRNGLSPPERAGRSRSGSRPGRAEPPARLGAPSSVRFRSRSSRRGASPRSSRRGASPRSSRRGASPRSSRRSVRAPPLPRPCPGREPWSRGSVSHPDPDRSRRGEPSRPSPGCRLVVRPEPPGRTRGARSSNSRSDRSSGRRAGRSSRRSRPPPALGRLSALGRPSSRRSGPSSKRRSGRPSKPRPWPCPERRPWPCPERRPWPCPERRSPSPVRPESRPPGRSVRRDRSVPGRSAPGERSPPGWSARRERSSPGRSAHRGRSSDPQRACRPRPVSASRSTPAERRRRGSPVPGRSGRLP